MNNDSRSSSSIPAESRKKSRKRQSLDQVMAETVMPKVAAIVKMAAKDYAGKVSADPGLFDHDACAGEIMIEIIEFLWQCRVDSFDAPPVHVKQMKGKYFREWWEVGQ